MIAPGCLIIILVTCIVSVLAFQRRELVNKYIFSPDYILAGKQYYRLITCAFLHADWYHLLVNMYSLYLFGSILEIYLGKLAFFTIYFGSILGGSLLSLYLHRHHDYRSYGASGGACGVIFASVLLNPFRGVMMLPIPVFIPGWIYALVFMGWSFWQMKHGWDNIGHDAHLGGAVVGLGIAAAFEPMAVQAHWAIFTLLFVVAGGMIFYVWKNPLFLPLSSFWQPGRISGRAAGSGGSRRPERLRVDEILEKINRQGINSLTAEERATLDEVSGKYRRRGESKKPDSDLII